MAYVVVAVALLDEASGTRLDHPRKRESSHEVEQEPREQVVEDDATVFEDDLPLGLVSSEEAQHNVRHEVHVKPCLQHSEESSSCHCDHCKEVSHDSNPAGAYVLIDDADDVGLLLGVELFVEDFSFFPLTIEMNCVFAANNANL